MSTIEFQGTGGIIEGNLGSHNVNVNLDKSLMFDGTNDFIDCGTDTDHDFTDHFTLACWAKNDNATTTDGHREHLIAKYEGSSGKRIFRLYLHGSTLRFGVGYNSGDNSVEITHSMTGLAEHWNHYAASFDGGVMKLYVNGVLVTNTDHGPSGTNTLSAIHANNAIELEIGAYQSGNHTWTGQIADVRIYNAVVDQPDIQLLASKINTDSSLGAGTTNLKGYWKLNNETASGGGSGTGFVVDESGTVNQGTLTNFSGTYWDYDAYSVDVYDNSTTTDGTFTVTQGKVEGLALTSADFTRSTNDSKITIASGPSLTDTHTLAIWVRHDETTGAQTYFGWGSAQYFDIQNSLDDFVYRVGSQSVTVDISDALGSSLSINRWYHIAAVRSGTTVTFYVDGVNIGSATNGSMTGTDTLETIGAEFSGDANYGMGGRLRDARVYLQALSDEQVASLYSGTLVQTPNNWWKIDEGTGGNGDSVEDYGTGTDADGVLAPAGNAPNWVNGTLDLDGTLTIQANGTLSAPRGDLDLAGNFTMAADTSTYTHNSGTFKPSANCELLPTDFDSSENARHIFHNVAHTGGTLYLERPCKIEGTYTKTGGELRHYAKVTFGTDTASGNMVINHTSWNMYGYYGSPYLYAANQLFPLEVKGSGYSSDGPIDWDTINNEARSPDTFNYIKWVDFQKNMVTGGNGGDIVMQGDCSFAALTITSGDSLDLNGQRVEFSGVLSGGGALKANNSTLVFTGTSGTVFDGGEGPDLSVTDSTDCTFICDAGSGSQEWKNRFQSSDATIFVQSGTLSLSYWNWEDITNFFVGGTFNNSSANRNVTTDNLTIPTGGILSAGSGTFTCAGDFTTSGGLIGKSAMVVSGDNDYEGMVVTELQAKGDWGFSGNQGLTIEGWFKFDDLDFGTGNDAILVGHVRSGDTTGKRYGCGLQIMDDKVMAIAANNDTAHTHYDNCSFPVSDLTAGKWHHLAMTVDDANLSSTPLTKLYLDGKLKAQVTGVTTVYFGYNWVVGGYADNHDSQGWTNRRMDGAIARCSAFRQEMTAAQIRSIMFTTYDEMAALTNGVDEARTVGWWQFDEGQGNTVDNKGTAGAPPSSDHSNFDGTIAAAGTTWAGAGTFTPNTSTVVMAKSGTQTIAYTHLDNDFANLTINAGSTTQMLSMGESGNNALQDINRSFTVNGIFKSHPDTTGARVRLRNPAYTFSVDSSVKATALADLGTLKFDGNGTFNLPEFTTKIIQPTSSGTILALTGPLTVTEELDVATGTTINTKGHNLTTKVVDLVSGGTFNIEKNSSLIFSDVSGCGFGSSAGTLNCKGSAAASFDGNDDKMEDTSNPLPASGPFTFTMFFRTSTTGIRQGLVDFTASTARGMLDVMTDNKLLLYLGGSNYRYWDPITSYLDGEWHHIAVYVPGYAQADVNNITVHIDGNLINPSATVDTGAAQQPTMADLKLGCGYSSGNAWDGDLADARIFEKALTADNLTTLRSIKPNKANATSYSDASNVIGATHWWKLNESNFPSDDAADSVGSIALSVTGAVSNRITVTSATGGTPSNYWDNDTGMDVTAHYTTFDKSSGSFYTSSSTIDIDNCTYSNHDAGATVYFNDTGTITSFTNNTISCNSVSKGLLSTKAHAAFDNITITNSADYDVKVTGERIEFTNSNFDITKVELGDSSSHLISSVHNDTENLYEICAGSGGLTYSAITNKPDIPNGVLRQRTGLFLFNSDNKEFNTLNVFSGATIRVSDTKDMYLTVFDNDGTWDQSTSGYTTGEIHVGDFTPFDSGDIIDETDFVDTGFHDTTHYLEMDL